MIREGESQKKKKSIQKKSMDVDIKILDASAKQNKEGNKSSGNQK